MDCDTIANCDLTRITIGDRLAVLCPHHKKAASQPFLVANGYRFSGQRGWLE
jgi:hypothetical protein